mmetsp:Transcript_20494/g.53305  ORF Transcript_20494/g.53305 Transcript_20494/m.53305 type:complete len:273 (-) Transcript_20494:2051-2869(-)
MASASASLRCCSSICFRARASSSALLRASSSSCFFLRSASIFSARSLRRFASASSCCFFCSFSIAESCFLILASRLSRSAIICSRVISSVILILSIAPFRSFITPSTCAIILSLFFSIFSTVERMPSIWSIDTRKSLTPMYRWRWRFFCKYILITFCMMIAAPARARIFEANLIDATVAQATFFHRALTSQSITLPTSATSESGSALMMVSNSANLPGRKNTRDTPNWKSSSLIPRALNSALANVRGSSAASSGGSTALYMSYRSLNSVRDG